MAKRHSARRRGHPQGQLPPGWHAALGEQCFLCGGLATGLVMFTPDRPQEYGAPPGKERRIFYNICDACQQAPDWVAQVEAELLRQMWAPWN
jgi:hypothetical protein